VEITLVSEREAADQPELFVEPEEPEEDDGGPTPEGVLEAALALSGREDAGARRRLEALTAEPGGRRTLLEQLEGRQDVPALLLAAELHVAEDDPFSAEQALAAALEQEPKLPGALALLARLYRARESWKGYVQVLTQQAGLAGDRQRWGDLLLEVAQVRHERMGERKAALATVNAVLRAFPDRADALVLLAELLEAEARPADALAMLRRALDQPDLPDRLRVGVLERAARLAGLAGVPEQEVAAWWAEVLEHVPGHPAALEALQVHHEQRGNLRAELAVVEQRLDGLQGDLETQRARRVRSGLHARRAVLVLRLSGSGERARAELERAIEDWDENVEAYEALAGLYREEGETGRLLDVLERLEELMVPGPARNALAAERAALLAGGG